MGAREDLAELRQEYPGWNFSSVWTSPDSGPGLTRLTASRDGILLTAWNRAELARKIKYEESQMGGCC